MENDETLTPENAKKLKLDDQQSETNDTNEIGIEDIHRTGAKCVPSSEAKDSKEKGVGYHVTGVVRTKPGMFIFVKLYKKIFQLLKLYLFLISYNLIFFIILTKKGFKKVYL